MARKRPDNATAISRSPMKLATKAPRRAKPDAGTDKNGGVTDSHEMLALRPYLKKSRAGDKATQQFRSKVQKDRNDLRSSLQKRVQRAESENKRRCNDIASMILNALLAPAHSEKPAGGPPTLISSTSIARSTAHSSAKQVKADWKKLLEDYNAIENLIRTITPEDNQQITENWTKEVNLAQTKLDVGYRVALRSVKKVLGMDDKEGEDVEGDEEWPKVPINQELQKTLYYAERGVKRLAKGLPFED